MLLLIVGLILFVALVVVHEYGHYIAARRNGVEVEEFGIGFPPRAKVLAKRHKTVFSLNWLPLGGFVKLKGENDASSEPGSYGASSLSTKVKIMTAGVIMNLITAFVLLTVSALLGMPKVLDNQFAVNSDIKRTQNKVYIGYVEPDSPASQAGLAVRDQIISFTNSGSTIDLKSAEELPKLTEKLAGETVQITVKRDGEVKHAFASLRTVDEVTRSDEEQNPKGHLGIAPLEYSLQRSTWSAPVVAAGLIKQFTIETFKGLGSIVSGLASGNTKKATEQVSGPIGIYVILKDGSTLGYEFVLFVIAVISLTLAIMNILPIPALDGGRLFVTLLFRGIKKPLNKELEDKIHGTGFALLMLLIVMITIVDIDRFF